jgi:outer membrane protein TolC
MLIPKVCPAENTMQAIDSAVQVRSDAILLPAGKPHQAVPPDTDVVTTPGLSPSKRPMVTKVPGVSGSLTSAFLKDPISLDQALEIAFRNSPSIQSALSAVEMSRGSVDAADAQFNPTFNLQSTTTYQGPIPTLNANGQEMPMEASPANTLGLSFTLPLDISHQLKYSSDVARYEFQLRYLSMVSTSQQLIVDVKSAYYGLLRACGEESAVQAAVDDSQTRLNNIRAKYEEGAAPRYDVTSAEVELDNLNQQLLAAKNTIAICQSTLNGVLGLDANSPTRILSSDVSMTITTVDMSKSVQEAYAKRADLKAAQVEVTLYKRNIRLQGVKLLPSMNLSGGPSYQFNPSGFSTSKYTWSACVTLNIPIWDGGVAKADIRQAKASLQSSIADLNQMRISVGQDVRKSALNLQDAALRTKTTIHAVSLAEDALSVAYDRYNSGVATLVEVSNAQSELTQARDNYVDAQYDYALAVAQFEKATATQPELNRLQLLADDEQHRSSMKEAKQ